jgi:two-component system, OmpR family, response regulator
MRALVIEDHSRMSELLARGMREEGYEVDTADTASQGMWLATEFEYDVVLLDVMLPDGDGIESLRKLRADGTWTPVLLVTAKDAVEDRVRGLDAGADDYLAKPFALPELLARLRALTRRGPSERPSVLAVGDLVLDPAMREVRRADTPIHLTPKEFVLLELLMRRAGEVLPRATIMEHAWDFAFDGDWNILDVYIRYLREKVDRPFGKHTIETVRGVGYRLRAEETCASPSASG